MKSKKFGKGVASIKKDLRGGKLTKEEPPKKESMHDRLESELETMGIKPFGNESVDEDYLLLPASLTDVMSRDLGNYFSAFTQQKMWVRTCVGRVKAEWRETNLTLDDFKATVYSGLPTRMSSKDKELHLIENNTAKELIHRATYLASKLDMLENYLLNLEDAITNVSREITRRGFDRE